MRHRDGHRRGARRGRRDRDAGAARRALRLPPVQRQRARRQEVADHALPSERAVDQGRRPDGDGVRPRGGARAQGGLRRGRDHGLGGVPDQPVPRASAPTTATTSGAVPPTADALPGRGRAPLARAGAGEGFPIVYRISLLDLVEDGQTWDEVVELAPPARGRRRHGAQHRHRLARGAGADDHHPGPARRVALADRAAQGRGVGPGVRVQPDQQPRAWPRRSSRPAAPTWSRWRGRCWPTRLRRARPPPGAPTRSTPASPATRPASTTCSPTRRASCLVNPRACRETELVLLPLPSTVPAKPGPKVAVVGAGPAGLAAAVVRCRARLRGHAVREGRRDRRAVPAGDGRARQGGLRRDAALLRPPPRGARRRRAARRRDDARRPGAVRRGHRGDRRRAAHPRARRDRPPDPWRRTPTC